MLHENLSVTLQILALIGTFNSISGSCANVFKRQCLRGSGLRYCDAKQIFKKFKPDKATKADTVRAAEERILTRGDSDINDAFEKCKTAKGLDEVDKFTLDQMEELAVFAYQENPFVNHSFQKLYYSASLDPRLKNLDKINAATDQAILIQSYLKEHQIPEATTVYRFESDFNLNRYKIGKKFTEKTFLSTTKTNDRHNIRGLMNSPRFRSREIKILDLSVGADIESVNPRFSHQKEIVIPFGTKFRTRSI